METNAEAGRTTETAGGTAITESVGAESAMPEPVFVESMAANARRRMPLFRQCVNPKRLAESRLKKGASQEGLAESLMAELSAGPGSPAQKAPAAPRISPSAVLSWEIGRRYVPNKYVGPLCRLLGVSQWYLCGFDSEPAELAGEIPALPMSH